MDNQEQKQSSTGSSKPVQKEKPDKNYSKTPEQKKRRRYYKYPRKNSGSSNKEKGSGGKKYSARKVSLLIPLFNEAESIRPLYNDINKTLKPLSINYEIFFVDDGSTDNSYGVIKELAKRDNKVKFISFRKNYGKSAALQTGFRSVTGDVIITLDADLQDDPAEIPNLLAKMDEGYDLVSGWKKKRFDPLVKRQSSKFFNWVTRVISGIKIHDFNCGLKAYKKEVVENIQVHGELHRYIPVFADWQGFRITEIPVRHHPRRYGKTKFGISRFFKGFVDLITVIFTTRYIRRPMHLFGFLGAVSFLAGFAINGYLTYEWLLHKTFISNRPLLFLGMLLIIVGVQFFSVGLLGEIMVHNAKDDSDYSIKDRK